MVTRKSIIVYFYNALWNNEFSAKTTIAKLGIFE